MKIRRIFAVFFSLLLAVTLSVDAFAADGDVGSLPDGEAAAKAALLIDPDTEEILYARNIHERLYPASTTKILTAYIALKYCDDLDAMVTVSENAVNQASDSSVCNLKAGDVIRLRDLLYGLMLRSGKKKFHRIVLK